MGRQNYPETTLRSTPGDSSTRAPRGRGRRGKGPEVPPGIEPGIEVLQTSALPLGYGTERAGNRARTGDLNLGKVALYQLSYARKP